MRNDALCQTLVTWLTYTTYHACACLCNTFQKPRPLTLGEIAENWNSHLKETLTHRYGKRKDELVHEFGDMRDTWMQQDPEGWLRANSFFETRGVLEAVKESSANVYIITTKQHRFADALIKHAGLNIPDGQVRVCP